MIADEYVQSYLFGNIRKVDDCWIWKGPVSPKGKPICDNFIKKEHGFISAYRLSNWVMTGEKRYIKNTKRTCGNDLCCNPIHVKKKETTEIRKGDEFDIEAYSKNQLRYNKNHIKANHFCQANLVSKQFQGDCGYYG